MIEALSILLKEFDPTIYILFEKRIKSLLDQISEREFICNYVPEIDIVLKD